MIWSLFALSVFAALSHLSQGERQGCLFFDKRYHKQVGKPDSVENGHLSRRTVADALQPPPRGLPGKHCPLRGVAPDRVYITGLSPTGGCALTAPFHPYRRKLRRYLSVALVLKSPSAGVTRYPCPMEPGLSSRTDFRLVPATV